MEKNYKDIYEKYIAYEEKSHEKNQKKIRVGLRVNILLPLVFLTISFMTNGSKLIFLILWIVSLFGIAAYLINVEYRDYRMQERLKLFAGEENAEELEVGELIGSQVAVVEEKVTGKIDIVDNKIAGMKQKRAERRAENREKVGEAISGLINRSAGSDEPADDEAHEEVDITDDGEDSDD